MSPADLIPLSVTETPLGLLQLLRLSSPLLPIGAFAYSQGLEQVVHEGIVATPGQLEAWLVGLLEHVLSQVDLPLLGRAFDAAQGANSAGLSQLSAWILALRESAELRAEEQHLGTALARLLANLDVAGAREFVGSDEASYVVMFGLAAAHYGVSKRGALLGYGFAWIENQVSAALRCLSIGQQAAQVVLCSVLDRLPRVVDRALGVTDDDIGFSSPGIALASIRHELLYSRLFRS
jgi:urease accessory protein